MAQSYVNALGQNPVDTQGATDAAKSLDNTNVLQDQDGIEPS
jgi:hypothetical protein